MSATDLKNVDVSAADKEHLGLPEGSRKPFHQVLLDEIRKYDGYGLSVIVSFAQATIPKDHDEIVTAIEEKMATNQLAQSDLTDLKRMVLDQKAEAEARNAEKAKQVSDADKVVALIKLANAMFNTVKDPSIDDRVILNKLVLLGFVLADIEGNPTREQFQRAVEAIK